MGHSVHHATYDEKVNKNQVQNYWDEYAAHEDWQEGCSGLSQNIRWIDYICDDREEIINSFTRIDGKRVNNSYIESKNRQIEHLMNNANGFVNFQRTRNRILYCLNKSDTYLF